MRRAYVVGIVVLAGALGVLAIALIAPDRLRRSWPNLRPESPHERYARALREGALAQTALAADWLAAATRAVRAPVPLIVPFTEAALVDPARPVALGYEVALKRGQRLDVSVTVETDTPGQVFLDLFGPGESAGSEEPVRRPRASAKPDTTTLSYEVPETGVYVLRVQPELLRGGHLKVTSLRSASLLFPVPDAHGIKSVFGDPRDAGLRRHEGVDIFARAGTPIRATADGIVTRVGETTRGGRVVWVTDIPRGVSYYYAHLQEQLVTTGTFVRAGDVLGTVGNTGNARTTPPHLHFGIYARGEGAIDPEPFIRPITASAPDPALRAETLGAWARTRRPAALRASPSPDGPILEALPRGSAVRVEGAVGPWVRTRTDTHRSVFVAARELTVDAGAMP